MIDVTWLFICQYIYLIVDHTYMIYYQQHCDLIHVTTTPSSTYRIDCCIPRNKSLFKPRLFYSSLCHLDRFIGEKKRPIELSTKVIKSIATWEGAIYHRQKDSINWKVTNELKTSLFYRITKSNNDLFYLFILYLEFIFHIIKVINNENKNKILLQVRKLVHSQSPTHAPPHPPVLRPSTFSFPSCVMLTN